MKRSLRDRKRKESAVVAVLLAIAMFFGSLGVCGAGVYAEETQSNAATEEESTVSDSVTETASEEDTLYSNPPTDAGVGDSDEITEASTTVTEEGATAGSTEGTTEAGGTGTERTTEETSDEPEDTVESESVGEAPTATESESESTSEAETETETETETEMETETESELETETALPMMMRARSLSVTSMPLRVTSPEVENITVEYGPGFEQGFDLDALVDTEHWKIEYDVKNGIPQNINAVYTITNDDVDADGKISIDGTSLCNFISYGLPTTTWAGLIKVSLTIKNASDYNIKFDDYAFSTRGSSESFMLRQGNTWQPDLENAVLKKYGSNYWGQFWEQYLPYLDESTYDCPVVEAVGFDGLQIPLAMIPCREDMEILRQFAEDNGIQLKIGNRISLKEMVLTIPEKMEELEKSFSEVVCDYYNVSSLEEISSKQMARTLFASESHISCYETTYYGVGEGYKYLAYDNRDFSSLFSAYGDAGMDRNINGKKALFSPYKIKEWDPEIQKLAYRFAYEGLMRFTFDSALDPISYYDTDENWSEESLQFSVMNFIDHEEENTAHVRAAFHADEVLESGEEIAVSNIRAGVVPVDAFDEYNMYVMSFSLSYMTDHYDFEILKTDDAGTGLADAVFELTDSEGAAVYFIKNGEGEYCASQENAEGASKSLVTDHDGKIFLKGLSDSSYTLKETVPPSGYKLDGQEYVVQDNTKIQGEDGDYGVNELAISNVPLGKKNLKLTIRKNVESTGVPFTGKMNVEFLVTELNDVSTEGENIFGWQSETVLKDTAVLTFESEKSENSIGYTIPDIIENSTHYYLVEEKENVQDNITNDSTVYLIEAKATATDVETLILRGALEDADKSFRKTEIVGGTEIEFTNTYCEKYHGILNLAKTDAVTDSVLTGSEAAFLLEKNDVKLYFNYDEDKKCYSYTTSADGVTNLKTVKGRLTLVGIPEGSYVLKEAEAPEGYIKDTKTYSLTVSAPNTSSDKADVALYLGRQKMTAGKDGCYHIANKSETTEIEIRKVWSKDVKADAVTAVLEGRTKNGSVDFGAMDIFKNNPNVSKGVSAGQLYVEIARSGPQKSWSATVKGLPAYLNGEAVTYTVTAERYKNENSWNLAKSGQELTVNGLRCLVTIEQTADGWTITNEVEEETETPSETETETETPSETEIESETASGTESPSETETPTDSSKPSEPDRRTGEENEGEDEREEDSGYEPVPVVTSKKADPVTVPDVIGQEETTEEQTEGRTGDILGSVVGAATGDMQNPEIWMGLMLIQAGVIWLLLSKRRADNQ